MKMKKVVIRKTKKGINVLLAIWMKQEISKLMIHYKKSQKKQMSKNVNKILTLIKRLKLIIFIRLLKIIKLINTNN